MSMFSLKTHAVITASLFAAIVLFAIAGNILHDQGLLADTSTAQWAARYLFFALFLAFGFSAIPLMMKLVLAGQVAIGNAEVGLVRAAIDHQAGIVIALWLLIGAGLSLAIPAAIKDGFFDPDPAAVIAATPSRGTLVAAPGMRIDDMRRLSSLEIKGSATSVFADGTLFDFTVAGTDISFARCRYYYMTTFNNDRERIEHISIGTAQSQMTRAQLAGADAALRERLAADGWLTGYENDRTEQQRRFHGGLPGGPSGAIWLKGDTVLRIMARRLDDPKPGEDVAAAGAWIQFVELSRRASSPGIERYEFAKPY